LVGLAQMNWMLALRSFKLTVNRTMFGGLNGYSGGSKIRPWYTPPSNSVSRGPRTVKCHSKRLSFGEKEKDFVVKKKNFVNRPTYEPLVEMRHVDYFFPLPFP